MSFLDTLKKLIGVKTDEVVAEVVEEKAAEEVIPMVEEKPQAVEEKVCGENCDCNEKPCDADCDCDTEEVAPKTDDSVMGDNQ